MVLATPRCHGVTCHGSIMPMGMESHIRVLVMPLGCGVTCQGSSMLMDYGVTCQISGL